MRLLVSRVNRLSLVRVRMVRLSVRRLLSIGLIGLIIGWRILIIRVVVRLLVLFVLLVLMVRRLVPSCYRVNLVRILRNVGLVVILLRMSGRVLAFVRIVNLILLLFCIFMNVLVVMLVWLRLLILLVMILRFRRWLMRVELCWLWRGVCVE